jgi:hypothetical protein
MQSPAFAKLRSVIEMSTTQPEIQFCETTRSWGLQLVEKLRMPNEHAP